MELRDALSHISEIRRRMAESEFRGYRAMPAALSGLFALAAAAVQPWFVDTPVGFVTYWAILAVLCFGLSIGNMIACGLRSASPLFKRTTWLALEQLLPSLLAGALVTWVLVRFAPESLWLLPGLWQIFYGLGLLASRRLLPPAMPVVAALFILSGGLCLALASLSPWVMGLPFGIGQLLAGALLWERRGG